LPAIDAINRSPVAGLWEVRVGAVVFYADESGRYVVHGEMRDLGTQRNLTKDRVDQSTAITFTDLPWRDSLTTRRGTGERRIAVFADANCGSCKAMLGPVSRKRGSSILCAASPERAWQNWMLRSTMSKASKCDASALSRNEAYARRHLLRVTPTIVFADGSRHEGVLSVEQLRSKMAAAAAAGS
jgi:thiol:disulfide interchange protein DsbC